MGTTTNGVYNGGKSLRQKTALQGLEAQLVRGTKPRKGGMSYKDYPPDDVVYDAQNKPTAIKLSAKDITRINKEINILKGGNV